MSKSNNRVVETSDGSSSIYVPELDEHYHSKHGALRESEHVFIEAGLKAVPSESVKVLEMGFGTGLNAWLTAIHTNKPVEYHSIEKYPVELDLIRQLNYTDGCSRSEKELFKHIHQAEWNVLEEINSDFQLKKIQGDFYTAPIDSDYNLIYWDVFGHRVQPHLWEKELFEHVYSNMQSGGVLVTYSSKGVVRRTLIEIGFEVEKLKGPPGKREMLRAWKK